MNYFYDLSELNWEFFGFYDWIDAYHPEFYFVVCTQNLAIVSYLLIVPFCVEKSYALVVLSPVMNHVVYSNKYQPY